MDVKARVSSGDELLNEKFTIPSIITTPNPIDFNTFTTPGIFYVGSHPNNDSSDLNFVNNGPIRNWGTLIVSGTGGTLFQLFFSDSARAEIYHRRADNNNSTKDNIVWFDWVKLMDKNSALDKAFPVGFSYLSTDGSNSYIPSFGTWKVIAYGTIGDANQFESAHPIYKITRTA